MCPTKQKKYQSVDKNILGTRTPHFFLSKIIIILVKFDQIVKLESITQIVKFMGEIANLTNVKKNLKKFTFL